MKKIIEKQLEIKIISTVKVVVHDDRKRIDLKHDRVDIEHQIAEQCLTFVKDFDSDHTVDTVGGSDLLAFPNCYFIHED